MESKKKTAEVNIADDGLYVNKYPDKWDSLLESRYHGALKFLRAILSKEKPTNRIF